MYPGGAKNHLVALPDCDIGMTSRDVVVSFAGCCGQRCMAASVLVIVGEQSDDLLNVLVDTAAKLQPGTLPGQVGPIIDVVAKQRYIHIPLTSRHYVYICVLLCIHPLQLAMITSLRSDIFLLICNCLYCRTLSYINQAEKDGCKILVDGRSWAQKPEGFWVGPTVILHTNGTLFSYDLSM